jgi:hypothetical protein
MIDGLMGATGGLYAVRFYKNGVGFGPQSNLAVVANNNIANTHDVTVNAAANDYFECFVYSTQSMTVVSGSNATFFEVTEAT